VVAAAAKGRGSRNKKSNFMKRRNESFYNWMSIPGLGCRLNLFARYSGIADKFTAL
jgi:hypothetical protein